MSSCPGSREKIEVTRSRAYEKNDQAFVKQKNGAMSDGLVGYGRFDGGETTRVLERFMMLHLGCTPTSSSRPLAKVQATRGRKSNQALSGSGHTL